MLSIKIAFSSTIAGDSFPKPYLPVDACVHDGMSKEEADKVCKACEGAIKVKFEPLKCDGVNPGSQEDKQPPAKATHGAYKNAELDVRKYTP